MWTSSSRSPVSRAVSREMTSKNHRYSRPGAFIDSTVGNRQAFFDDTDHPLFLNSSNINMSKITEYRYESMILNIEN